MNVLRAISEWLDAHPRAFAPVALFFGITSWLRRLRRFAADLLARAVAFVLRLLGLIE